MERKRTVMGRVRQAQPSRKAMLAVAVLREQCIGGDLEGS